MAIDRRQHELKNAVLFLESFPEILRQHLASRGVPESRELDELLELLVDKLEVVKAGVGR